MVNAGRSPAATADILLTVDEARYLRHILIDWVDEGFTKPPYDPTIYSLFEKLGIRQRDIHEYDIERPTVFPSRHRPWLDPQID